MTVNDKLATEILNLCFYLLANSNGVGIDLSSEDIIKKFRRFIQEQNI